MTSGISICTLEIRQERTSRFYLRVEWTSVFKGSFYIIWTDGLPWPHLSGLSQPLGSPTSMKTDPKCALSVRSGEMSTLFSGSTSTRLPFSLSLRRTSRIGTWERGWRDVRRIVVPWECEKEENDHSCVTEGFSRLVRSRALGISPSLIRSQGKVCRNTWTNSRWPFSSTWITLFRARKGDLNS